MKYQRRAVLSGVFCYFYPDESEISNISFFTANLVLLSNQTP